MQMSWVRDGILVVVHLVSNGFCMRYLKQNLHLMIMPMYFISFIIYFWNFIEKFLLEMLFNFSSPKMHLNQI